MHVLWMWWCASSALSGPEVCIAYITVVVFYNYNLPLINCGILYRGKFGELTLFEHLARKFGELIDQLIG